MTVTGRQMARAAGISLLGVAVTVPVFGVFFVDVTTPVGFAIATVAGAIVGYVAASIDLARGQ